VPSHVHESCLIPLRDNFNQATQSLTHDIPKRFRPWVAAHMNSMLCASDGTSLGMPDLLVMIHSQKMLPIPLWATEVSFSETAEDVVTNLKRFAARCDHLFALTHIDITESRQHVLPKEISEATELLRDQKELSFGEWLSAGNDLTRTAGSIKLHDHIWVHAMKVTITTWLRHPNGGFDLDNHDPDVYACAVRCLMHSYLPPYQSATDLSIGTVPQQGVW
jgi:hypothetical protein